MSLILSLFLTVLCFYCFNCSLPVISPTAVETLLYCFETLLYCFETLVYCFLFHSR